MITFKYNFLDFSLFRASYKPHAIMTESYVDKLRVEFLRSRMMFWVHVGWWVPLLLWTSTTLSPTGVSSPRPSQRFFWCEIWRHPCPSSITVPSVSTVTQTRSTRPGKPVMVRIQWPSISIPFFSNSASH